MKIIVILAINLMLTSCATWLESADADRAAYYERLGNEAKQPGYEYKAEIEKHEESALSYGSCILEHTYFFNDRVARYICNRR